MGYLLSMTNMETTRPYDDLYNLRMREATRFPLTAAFCVCLNDERNNLNAEYVYQIDRSRQRDLGIPGIFG